jgi:ribokinase
MDPPALVAAGYINVDLVARVPALPGRDGRVTATTIERMLGGIAANVACAAARLGPPWAVRAELIATVGDDADSDWALAELRRRGVGADWVARRSGGRVTYCLILVEPGGERAIVSEPMDFDDRPLARRIDLPAPDAAPRALHVDGYRVPSVLPHVARARARGWRTSIDLDGLDAAWRTPAGVAELLGAFDLVFLNRAMAGEIWREPAAAERLPGLVEQARARAAGATGIVVATLGAAGALVLTGGGATPAPALPVAAVDTTGAGDVFAGAFLAAWLNGEPPARAAGHAAVAAALSTRGHGALGALPTAGEVLAAARAAGRA